MRLLLTLTFVSLFAACSGKQELSSDLNGMKVASKIYGGERVEEGKWKSVVSISKITTKDEIGDSFCTGTLIDEKTVISAAHCFNRVTEYYLRNSAISLQSIDSEKRSFTKIKKIRKHPKYTGEDSNFDFAIIDLEEALAVDSLDIIAPSKTLDIEEDAEVTLVGFGVIEDGTNGIKFEVSTSVRSDHGDEFIAGGEGKDTCAGDSGGPLFIKSESGNYELFGITSRTPDYAETFCGDQTIYGKVSLAMEWVRAEKLIDKALELDSLESIEILKKALVEYPNYLKTHTFLGEFYLKFGMLDEALAELKLANSLVKNDIKVLSLFRKLYYELGDSKKEVSYLRRLLVLEPSSEEFFERLVALDQIKIAEISRGIGRFKNDRLELAKLDLELHLDDPMAAYLVAFIEFKTGEFEVALSILEMIEKVSSVAVDFKDFRGDTFLVLAVYEGQIDLVDALLRFKPNLTVTDSAEYNLVEIAWWAKNFEMIKHLMSLGLEWNPDDYFLGLVNFIKGEMIQDVRFMLEMNIDLTLVDRDGKTALDLAKETNNEELIEMIVEAMADQAPEKV